MLGRILALVKRPDPFAHLASPPPPNGNTTQTWLVESVTALIEHAKERSRPFAWQVNFGHVITVLTLLVAVVLAWARLEAVAGEAAKLAAVHVADQQAHPTAAMKAAEFDREFGLHTGPLVERLKTQEAMLREIKRLMQRQARGRTSEPAETVED